MKTPEGRNDENLPVEIARAGAEITRLDRIRDRELQGVWKEWKDIWGSNNSSR